MYEKVEPEHEATRAAGLRDLLIGLMLITVGQITGGSVIYGGADPVDWFFDLLGVGFVLWGALRLIRR